jgi:hypothetical protein
LFIREEKGFMTTPVLCQPTLRVNSDPAAHGPSSVSVCCLDPDLVAYLASCPQAEDLLRSIFRLTVAPDPSSEVDGLPNVSGRYRFHEDEVEFIPHVPLERDVKYRVSCDSWALCTHAGEELTLEFAIPSDRQTQEHSKVTQIFPSCGLLPENLLRFYVFFSSPMQRGRALEEISLLDSNGRPVADALYRPPLELWDRTMRCLTVLLDPGRLKRGVGPYVELGLPLKADQKYTLEIGSGMIDQHGRPLGESFRKHFLATDPIRDPVRIENWTVLPSRTGGREAVVLTFPSPLDWALLLRTITIESRDGSVIEGKIVVDQCEKRWSFTPNSSWLPGDYHIRVSSDLEDVCGNDLAGPFDRPLRKNADPARQAEPSSLMFQLT